MKQFCYNCVVFVGDFVYQVFLFGVCGVNFGMQDVDNFGWKFGLVLDGFVFEILIDIYYEECVYGVDENILNLICLIDFIILKFKVSYMFCNVVLELVEYYVFLCLIVNFGWLLLLCIYDGLLLNGVDVLMGGFKCICVGSLCFDVLIEDGYLFDQFGDGFILVFFNVEVEYIGLIDGVFIVSL